MCTTGVVDTGGQGKKSSIIKVNYFVWTPLGSRVNLQIATGVIDTGGKFAAGIVDTLPPVSTKLAKLVAKFATGVVDTGGAP